VFSDPLPSNGNGADHVKTILAIRLPLLHARISGVAKKWVYMSQYITETLWNMGYFWTTQSKIKFAQQMLA
jgi:hypothetical protein